MKMILQFPQYRQLPVKWREISMIEKRTGNLYYKGIGNLSPQVNLSDYKILPEDGLPIGNGRMGTLVWLTPNALHMQINRVDVFGMDSSSHSVGGTDSDFSGGCAFVDIEFPGKQTYVFDENTEQTLDINKGQINIKGKDVEILCYGNMQEDFLVIEVKDHRKERTALSAHLRALRFQSQYAIGCNNRNYVHPVLYEDGVVSFSKQVHQLSMTILEKDEKQIGLRQIFTEKEFYCSSLVEIAAPGSEVYTWQRNPTEVVLEVISNIEAAETVFTITSYATLNKETIFERISVEEKCKDIAILRQQNEDWWKEFWERAPYLDFYSKNGRGQQITEDINYFFYIMALTSRGKYMPRYGGLLFQTGGDFKMWGAQYWWHNSSCYYAALISTGFMELAEPFILHMESWRKACENAAIQQWGTQGIWIPETTWFNGPEEIPEELREEFVQLYTCQKRWADRSDGFKKFAEGRNAFDARYSYISHREEGYAERGCGVFGYVTHIFSTTAKIAYWLWRCAQNVGEKEWLREHAYPFIRGAADMYVNLPLIKEGEDGLLHIVHCNNHEAIWDCTDAVSEMIAMHGIIPIAIKASEILGEDRERAEVWKEFLKKLAPIPVTTEANVLKTGKEEKECWASARSNGQHGCASHEHITDANVLYDYFTPETEDEEVRRIGENTLDFTMKHFGCNGNVRVNTLDMCVDAVARGCKPEAMEAFVGAMHDLTGYEDDFTDLKGCAYTKILANRMTLREGPQALDAQRLGHITSSMANAVCQGFPKAPGEEPVLYLFSSLPVNWDAKIRMKAFGEWQVEANTLNGKCEKITFSKGKKTIKLRNPWGTQRVQIIYAERKEEQEGKYLIITENCTVIAMHV